MEPKTHSHTVSPEEAVLERVRRKLQTCQHLLSAPSASAMLACGTCMGEIRFDLEALVRRLDSAPPEVRAGLRERLDEVAGEFRHARRLLDSAATLYKGWSHVLASHVRGYTRSGAPAALRHGSETLLRG